MANVTSRSSGSSHSPEKPGHRNRISKLFLPGISLFILGLTGCTTAPLSPTTIGTPEDFPAIVSAPATVKVLPNGLTVIIKENHTAPVAALRVLVKTGSIYEQEYLGSGISHVFEHMIHGGTTTTRKEKDIRDLLDYLGGYSNASTRHGRTSYYVTTTKEKIGQAIDLMSDWMQNCTFEQKEFDREIKVVMEELYKGREEPMRVLYKAFNETMFRFHPVRYPVIGYEESVKKLTRDDIVKYYKRMYVPNNMIAIVVGDFDANEMMQKMEASFKGLKRRALPAIVLPREPRQMGRRERVVENAAIRTAHFRIGFRSVMIDHPDLYPLDVLSYILSHGRSSRLVKSVVEQQRLADDVFSYSDTPEYDAGAFMLGGEGSPDKIRAAADAVIRELKKTKTALVTAEELTKAKRQKVADQVLYSQTVEDEADSLGVNMLMTGNANFDALYLRNIQKVTAEDIRRVARKYLHDENMTMVIMRPPKKGDSGKKTSAETKAGATRMVKLDSGLRVLIKRNPGIPLVTMQAYFLGGLRWEPADKAGINSLTGSLLTRGTTTRSGDAIAATFDKIGGRISGTSGNNTVGLTCEVLNRDFDTAINIFADVLQNATFPEAEFEKLKKRRLNAIAGQNDHWHRQTIRIFREEFFGKHPYRNSTLGTAKTVKDLSVVDVRRFYASRIVPSLGVVAVYGDVDEETAIAKVKSAFAGFNRPAPKLPKPNAAPQRKGAAVKAVPVKRGISAIAVGYPGTTLTNSKDRYPLIVLDTIMQARLYDEMRGKRNLVYMVYSSNFAGLDPGYFGVVAAATPKNMPMVEKLIHETVATVKSENVPDDELKRAKGQCTNSHVLGSQTNADMALSDLLDELYGLGYAHAADFSKNIEAVTKDDVMRVSKKYLVNPLTVRLDGQQPKPKGQ